MRRLRIITLICFILSAAALGASTAYRIWKTDDTVPVITCPDAPLVLSVKDSGTEALVRDVTAWDEKDGDLTADVMVEGIQRDADGTLTVTYVVADGDHHVTSRQRSVQYTDYTPPRFSLTQELRYSMGASVRIKDRMSAWDVIDGDLSDRIKVNSNDLSAYYEGTYPVTFEVTNSLGDTASITLDVVIRNYAAGEPRITLTKYLVYRAAGDPFDPMAYVESVTGGGAVSAQMPEGGLQPGVSRVTYTAVGTGGAVGSTVLYVVTE